MNDMLLKQATELCYATIFVNAQQKTWNVEYSKFDMKLQR
jgi:hypothetical protein